jgi:hypothetical protein
MGRLRVKEAPHHARWALMVIVLAFVAVACRLGQAHADILMNIRNDSAQTVTVRWRSSDLFGPSSLDIIDAGAARLNGIEAGTYTLSVDGATSTERLTVARSTGDPKTSLLVVNDDLSLTLQ